MYFFSRNNIHKRIFSLKCQLTNSKILLKVNIIGSLTQTSKCILLPGILISSMKSEWGWIFLLREDISLLRVGVTGVTCWKYACDSTLLVQEGLDLMISTNCLLKLGDYCFKNLKIISSFCCVGSLLWS